MKLAIIKHDGKTIGIADTEPQGIGLIQWFHRNCPACSAGHALQHQGYSLEHVDEIDCHGVEPLINAICDRAGVTMTAVFVPFSQSRNAGPDDTGKVRHSLNWRVTISRNGRDILTTDYMQGSGHAPAHKSKAFSTARAPGRIEAIEAECETGIVSRPAYGRPGYFSKRKPAPAPSIGDVMQCLARDADAIDAAGFDDWAAEYGYDTDSRKAESTYRECLEIGQKLRAGLGAGLLAEIQLAASFN